MTESKIHKALLDLEEGLRDVESARNQVERVTMSSTELTEATRLLTKKFAKFIQEFDNHGTVLTQDISNVSDQLSAATVKSIASMREVYSENETQLVECFDTVKDTTEDMVESLNALNTEINEVSHKVRNVDFDQMLKDLILDAQSREEKMQVKLNSLKRFQMLWNIILLIVILACAGLFLILK
jgi:uncharacterized coiled-coil DUF342 family protein